jgi:hypothetical protein
VGKRKNLKNKERGLQWFFYIIITILSLWIFASIYSRKDPQSVLNDIYQYALGNKAKVTKNDKQWNQYVNLKEQEIDSLKNLIVQLRDQNLPDVATVTTMSSGLNLRLLPSIDSEVISKITDGTEVILFYRDNETLNIGGELGFWVKVSYNGKQGYVFSPYLNL